MKDYEMLSDVKEAIYKTLADVTEDCSHLVDEAEESERQYVALQANMIVNFANDVLQNFMSNLSIVNRERVGDKEANDILEQSLKTDRVQYDENPQA